MYDLATFISSAILFLHLLDRRHISKSTSPRTLIGRGENIRFDLYPSYTPTLVFHVPVHGPADRFLIVFMGHWEIQRRYLQQLWHFSLHDADIYQHREGATARKTLINNERSRGCKLDRNPLFALTATDNKSMLPWFFYCWC